MGLKSFIVLLCTTLLIISCSSCKSGENQQSKDNLKKTGEEKMPFVGNPSLSPGTVKIKSLISSIKSDDSNIITLRIEDVLGYGQSAPVINKSEIVSIKLTNAQKEKILSSSDNLDLIIKVLPSGRGMEGSNIWQLITIE